MPPTAQSALTELIELHRARLREGDYDLLGQLDLIHTTRGTIDFRKHGPLIAKLRDRADLVLVSEWPRYLPPRERVLEAQCKKCAVPCEQCGGAGKSMCQVCGGAAKTFVRVQCPDCALKTGRFDLDCSTCHGSGEVREGVECSACSSSGRRICPRCFGEGKEGSGKYQGKTCPDCSGRGRAIAREPQLIEQFIHGKHEGFLALGPIRGYVLHAIEIAHIDIIDVRPDRDGNLSLALIDFSRGGAAAAYLVGGLPVLRPRTIG